MKSLKYSKLIFYPYLICIFIILPVVLHNYLFDVVTTKRTLFVAFTLLFLVAAIMYFIFNFKPFQLRSTDIWILIFLGINLISFLLSEYRSNALFGTSGRLFGLITIVAVCACYFIITGTGTLSEKICIIIMCGGTPVAILGILNFCGIDPLHIYSTMVYYQHDYFISTLGHTNIYSSFFAITLPVSLIMFTNSCSIRSRLFYGFTSVIAFMGIIVGNSDSGIISIATAIICGYIFCTSYKKLCYYWGMLVLWFTSARIVGLIYVVSKSTRLVDSINLFIMTNPRFYLIILLIIFLLIYSYIMHRRKASRFEVDKKILIFFSLTLFFIIFIYILYLNISGADSTLSNLLVFNDSWGTNRGFIWIRSIKCYINNYNFPLKLFGCGPDSYGFIVSQYFLNDILNGGFEMYDNAHNEYIQYLMTLGITGLSAYVGILASTIRRFIKSRHTPVTIALISAMICYILQAFVNINQAVTTPLFFAVVALLNTRSHIE